MEKRRDSKGRNLRPGENQETNGCYRYRWQDKSGKRCTVRAWRLVPTDKTPAGKREGPCLRELEKVISDDMRDDVDGQRANKCSVNDIFALYMSGKKDLAQSTKQNYNYMYSHYVADDFGLKKISAVKYSDVKAFYNFLIHERGFKPNSMEVINTILHPVFSLAVRDGLIRSNPTDGVMNEIKKSRDWTKTKRHALTMEEQAAFVNFVTGSDIYRHWGPLFTFLLGTGARIGEALGLRWEDCDFKNRTININHQLIYRPQETGKCEFHITTPKTAAGCRTIPMLKEVHNSLIQERKRQMVEGFCDSEVDGYSGFVFTNRDRKPLNPQCVNRAIERIRVACNEHERETAQTEHREPIQIPHFSAHNLRHTFCTRFCENETNLKVIQTIMGHADISTTMDIYSSCSEERKAAAFTSIEGKIKIS